MLKTRDAFKLAKIIKKYDLQKKIKEITKKIDMQQDASDIGVDFFFELILEDSTEDAFYEIAGLILNKEPKEIKEMEIFSLIDEISKCEDIKNFSDAVCKLTAPASHQQA